MTSSKRNELGYVIHSAKGREIKPHADRREAIEAGREMAARLQPSWGVDVIRISDGKIVKHIN